MFQQFFQGLRTPPKPRHVAESLLLALGFGAIAYALKPDLIDLAIAPSLQELALVLPIAFVVPALTEEVIFRGLLIPTFSWRWVIPSTTSYVLWHPIEAYAFLPAALPLFTQPIFLSLVAVLGVLCVVTYLRTGSLWTSVLLHWWVVAGWKIFGGAGFIA